MLTLKHVLHLNGCDSPLIVISGGGSRLAGADGRRCHIVGDLMVREEVGKEVGGDRGADQEDGR
jgi:hypothetical protein